MKKFYFDTAGWMAMADKKDPKHLRSIAFRDKSLEQGAAFVTSEFVLDETLTLIRMRLGLDAAEKWWKVISESPRCEIKWITPEHVRQALDIFFHWRDHAFSFTDCTSFVLMRELGIENALTGDRHFIIAGFQIHP